MLILTSCNTKQPSFTQEEVEKAVLELENQALGYWTAGNPSKFSVNFATDASWFDDINAHIRLDGIEEIQEHFNSLEGAIPVHKYDLVDTRVQSFGNIAILTLHYAPTLDGVEYDPTWKATSVYHHNNDKWQVVHAHWSEIKTE
jgi:hypothetical protein